MLKGHFSSENYPQKCRLIKFVSETNLMDWQKSLKIDDYYINEVGIYDLLVSSQQPLAKELAEYMGIKIMGHKYARKE